MFVVVGDFFIVLILGVMFERLDVFCEIRFDLGGIFFFTG